MVHLRQSCQGNASVSPRHYPLWDSTTVIGIQWLFTLIKTWSKFQTGLGKAKLLHKCLTCNYLAHSRTHPILGKKKRHVIGPHSERSLNTRLPQDLGEKKKEFLYNAISHSIQLNKKVKNNNKSRLHNYIMVAFIIVFSYMLTNNYLSLVRRLMLSPVVWSLLTIMVPEIKYNLIIHTFHTRLTGQT